MRLHCIRLILIIRNRHIYTNTNNTILSTNIIATISATKISNVRYFFTCIVLRFCKYALYSFAVSFTFATPPV